MIKIEPNGYGDGISNDGSMISCNNDMLSLYNNDDIIFNDNNKLRGCFLPKSILYHPLLWTSQ